MLYRGPPVFCIPKIRNKCNIFNRQVYNRYTERVFLSWCTNKLDIHGNFSRLLDLLINKRVHDCYGLVYFSHLPVKPRQ